MPRENEDWSIDGYKIDSIIHRGANGSNVYRVTKNEEVYAMKIIGEFQSPNNTVIAMDEVYRLKSIRHPFIIRYFESLHWNFNGPQTYIVMEYCTGANMSRAIQETKDRNGRFPASQIMVWLVQLLMAVAHLHYKCIIHREIKPNNIFIMDNDQRVKLGDFGLIKVLDSDASVALTSGKRLRNGYRAPELWRGVAFRCKVDEWSLGCLLYELMCLQPPFANNKMDDIVSANYGHIPLGDYHNAGIVQVMHDLLTPDPEERPHAITILDRRELQETRAHVQQMFEELANIALIPSADVPPDNVDEFSALEIGTLDDCSSDLRDMSSEDLVGITWSRMVDGYGGSLAFKPVILPPQSGGHKVQLWIMRRTPEWGIPPDVKKDMRLLVQTQFQSRDTLRLRLKINVKIQFRMSDRQIFLYSKCDQDALTAVASLKKDILHRELTFNWDGLDKTTPPFASVTITAERL